MSTKRWTRSPRGKIFGVATGLAEWRDLPVEPVRLIVFAIILFTGILPGSIIYLALALILPMQSAADYQDSSYTYGRNPKYKYQDAEYEENDEKTTEELKEEYENLKKKVEQMEEQMFDKERDWDERFNEGK